MYSIRNLGWMVAGFAILMLVGCNDTTNVVPDTKDQVQEQAPELQPQDQIGEQLEEDLPQEQTAPSSEEGLPPTVLEAATTVIRALKNSDMSTLAAWAHPEKGIRFTPYGHIDTEKDLIFTRDELGAVMQDPKEWMWRTFPGSGEEIKLTFAEYFKRFIYDADFMKDAQIAVNEGLGEGVMIYNLKEVYPEEQYDFVEYHIAGIDQSVDVIDWRSLRLVFEKIGEDRALVGIIHDQWTP